MMILILGGSGSGKSYYAENTAVLLSKSHSLENDYSIRKYYLATMQINDDEGRRKIKRHRELRNGKGFITIEQSIEIHKALEKMQAGEKVVLLECISNLTANEMFSQGEVKSDTQVTENVIRGIEILKKKATHLVVVSNNVFEDGIIYDKETMAYIYAMGVINQRLATLADKVVEVVAGIPITIK